MSISKKDKIVVLTIRIPRSGITQYGFSGSQQLISALVKTPTANDRLKLAKENMTPVDFQDPKGRHYPAVVHFSEQNTWGHTVTAAGEKVDAANATLKKMLIGRPDKDNMRLDFDCRSIQPT